MIKSEEGVVSIIGEQVVVEAEFLCATLSLKKAMMQDFRMDEKHANKRISKLVKFALTSDAEPHNPSEVKE